LQLLRDFKRIPIVDPNTGLWVDTEPYNVEELFGVSPAVRILLESFLGVDMQSEERLNS
jgi:hypothetical protein